MRAERSRLLGVATLASVTAGGAGVLLDGAWLWIAVAVAAAGTALGGFVVFAEHEPRGVPVESLALPVVACVSAAGFARIAGPTGWLVPATVAGGGLVFLALVAEGRLIGPIGPELPQRAGPVVPLAVLLAFTAFVAVASAVPGGFADPTLVALDEASLVLMAAADGVVAFLLGYRLAALDAPGLAGAISAAGTFAAIVGVSAALTRAWSLPRLLGPAVLAAVFYLWSAYRAASAAERRSSRWIWEYVALAGAAAIAVAWNLLLR